MAIIKDPVLFSSCFGIDATALQDAGLIDPFLDVDTQLFIDPVLLEKSSNKRIVFGSDYFTLFLKYASQQPKWCGSKKSGDASN